VALGSLNGVGKSLLIIDDEEEIREMLVSLFEDSFETILQAENGKNGLDIIRDQKPSVIISDFNMPKLNGLELLKFLRDEGIKTPVIWITGHASREVLRDAWVSGVYDFFEKPFNSDALKECAIGALDWGKNFNATRVPSFVQQMKAQEIHLTIDSSNYGHLIRLCEERGTSMTSLINHLIEDELKKVV
jgi:two-component system chemotaxis response regulator CheY